MHQLDTTFTFERLMRVVISAVAVAGLLWLGRFMWRQFFGILLSRNEAVILGTGVMIFLLLANPALDFLTTLTYGGIVLAGYFASKLAANFLR